MRLAFDQDHRLRVTDLRISKAGVSHYRGEEILRADPTALVEPHKVYAVLRPPAALDQAAHSFAGIPLLDWHVRFFNEDIPPEAVCGVIGSKVVFDGKYLIAKDAAIWSQGAIDRISAGLGGSMSAGYRFAIDHRPGTFRGQPFDLSMRDLHGHHVALVRRSRAGNDVSITPPLPREYRPAA